MKFGIATHAVHGSKYNGDMYLIKEFDQKVLISLADGLGHGEPAAIASSRCIRCIEEHYRSGLPEIFKYCDAGLRKTNGAVMGIALIDLDGLFLSYAGVGNISARIFGRGQLNLISRDGIIGFRLPKIREYNYPYNSGDTIIMHSDGISSKVIHYPESNIFNRAVQEIADEILKLYGKEEDDATVIVAR